MLLLFVRSAMRGICCYAIFLSDILNNTRAVLDDRRLSSEYLALRQDISRSVTVFDTFNESYHLF